MLKKQTTTIGFTLTILLAIGSVFAGRFFFGNPGLDPAAPFHAGMDIAGVFVGAVLFYGCMAQVELKKGDKLFVHTDGVPEASNTENKMFGTDRMIRVLGTNAKARPKELLEAVQKAVGRFSGRAEQFDDLTMLCLEYKGSIANGQQEVT